MFSAPRTGNGLTFADTLPQTAVGPGQKRIKFYVMAPPFISALHSSPLLLCVMHKMFVIYVCRQFSVLCVR